MNKDLTNYLRLEYDKSDPSWKEFGLCKEVDPELFFSEDDRTYTGYHEAKKLCLACDVRAECLKYAMDNNEIYGIWGGLTPLQRKKLRRSVKLQNARP